VLTVQLAYFGGIQRRMDRLVAAGIQERLGFLSVGLIGFRLPPSPIRRSRTGRAVSGLGSMVQ
jgi:hypothetical protein